MKIQRPNWSHMVTVDTLDGWFDAHVEPINKMLEAGVEVYATRNRPEWLNNKFEDTPHKALLINIEPIKQETAADVLRDFVNDMSQYEHHTTQITPYIQRAKAALEREDEK